jgi:hypothetical protein
MKKFLTLIAFIAILSFGCATLQPAEDKPIPPMPKFDDTRAVIEVAEEGDFACLDAPETRAGRVLWFSAMLPDHTNLQNFAMWVFETGDMIIVRFGSDFEPNGLWYDYGRDLVPEYYFKNVNEVPGGNDICKGLEILRK